MKYSPPKKSISPVVATALLLVVAVTAVIGFQTWFNGYSSETYIKLEQNSNSGIMTTQIQNLIGNNLYFKNGFSSLKIESVKINNKNCYVSGLYKKGLNIIPLGNCTIKGKNDLVIISEKGIFNKKIYSDSEYENPCPTGYLLVQGNSILGTSNFCVMKYEAKNIGGIATSVTAGNPWVSINQTDSRLNCLNLGFKYHLINKKERITIARIVENDKTNWNSSVVGNGFVYSGHNDNVPANSLVADNNDNNGYYGTSNSALSNQRRTLNLSGNLIWDFSGNVWEWNNETILGQTGNLGKTVETWYEWPSITNLTIFSPTNLSFNSIKGIGQIYTGGQSNGILYNYISGGRWDSVTGAGIFSLSTNSGPSNLSSGIGFRCSYNP